ncbi:MAG: hypothetical protein Q4E13_00860 [Clostridia bacterium]|nr:hypothetical protein [Clostridia bacterium]
MKLFENELNNYRQLNKVARKGGVVLFGSTFSKNIPLGELKQDYEFDCDLYNRSLADLSVFDVGSVLKDCVTDLEPSKVLIQLGETDLERGFKSVSEIVAQYEMIISQIQSRVKDCRITIVSVCNTDGTLFPAELNTRLEDLAKRTGCQYADISSAPATEAPSVKAFCLLKYFFRDRISDYDALHMIFA